MHYSQTAHPRVLEFGLLALSIAALTLVGPRAMVALKEITAAPLSLSHLASATQHPSEPWEDPTPTVAPLLTVAPFVLPASNPTERARAVHCLSEAVYYEAAYEPEAGQRAVAQVVLNRVRDRNFPDTVCGVVFQGWWRKTGCQFSFVCDGSLVRRPPGEADWVRSRAIAEQALSGYVATQVGVATHYHADYVKPYWRTSLVEIEQIGAHIFYRWPGKAGEVESLTQEYAGGEVSYWEAASRQNPRKFARKTT